MARARPARDDRRGMTLAELLVVLTLMGVIGGMSWPALTGAWRRAQVTGAAREIVSTLALARSLSIGRVDGRLYGVLFRPDGVYRVVAVKPGVPVTAETCLDPAVGRAHGESYPIGDAVRIANFPGSGGAPFLIVYRVDGIPTADGATFPAPDSILRIRLESVAIDATVDVVVSRAAGTARAQ